MLYPSIHRDVFVAGVASLGRGWTAELGGTVSTETVLKIAGGIVAALVAAIGILWKALNDGRAELKASQEARIAQAERHAADMEVILDALRKKKEG